MIHPYGAPPAEISLTVVSDQSALPTGNPQAFEEGLRQQSCRTETFII